MDKIHIKGLELFAYHGVNPEEKRDGQTFILDITMSADLSGPRQTDSLDDTINYAAVRKTVQRAFTDEAYDLIERAAQVVCEAILREHPRVEKVELLLKKPEAPMNAKFDYVAVEIGLSRLPERGKLPCVPC